MVVVVVVVGWKQNKTVWDGTDAAGARVWPERDGVIVPQSTCNLTISRNHQQIPRNLSP